MNTELRFIEKLEKNCAAHPDDSALISADTGKSMTYAELWECSGRVYRFLRQKGIGKEDAVMITLPRGMDPVVTLIGIWRAGAAVVMLEADYQPERMEFIRLDAGCVLKIDEEQFSEIMAGAALEGYEETSLHDLAYLIYTSGTTGKPKVLTPASYDMN